MNEYSEA